MGGHIALFKISILTVPILTVPGMQICNFGEHICIPGAVFDSVAEKVDSLRR